MGGQAAGRGESVEAVGGQFVGCDAVPDVTGVGGVGEHVAEEVTELLLWPGYVLVAVEERGEFGAALLAGSLVHDQRIRMQYGFESLAGFPDLVPQGGEVLEVGGDMPVVPGDQDRLDVREVLVQRGAADAGVLGDPRHRRRARSMFSDEGRGGVQDRVTHIAAVRLDGLVPQPGHPLSIQSDESETLCIDKDRVSCKLAGMKRHETPRTSHTRHRSIALVVAVKVVIVVLVLALPSGVALSLGAAHGVALLLAAVAAVVLLVVKHRSRR